MVCYLGAPAANPWLGGVQSSALEESMDQSQSRKGARSTRAIGEFLLIVAGVSVALGAEALWETRQDRTREAEYIAQVRSDLSENTLRLREALELEEMTHLSIQTAIDAVVQQERISPDSAQAWLHDRRGLNYADPRPLTGTFSALIAYLPQLIYDHAEYDRWVHLYLPHMERLREIGIGVHPRNSSPVFPTNYALLYASTNPDVLAALHGVLQKHRNRRIYLDRMLESTRELADLMAIPN